MSHYVVVCVILVLSVAYNQVLSVAYIQTFYSANSRG